jgi:hypothetical protein
MNINSSKDILAKEIIKLVVSTTLLILSIIGLFSKDSIFPKIILKISGIVLSLISIGFYIRIKQAIGFINSLK